MDVDSDAATTLAVGVVNALMQNFTFRAHSSISAINYSIERCLAHACGVADDAASERIDTRPCRTTWGARYLAASYW